MFGHLLLLGVLAYHVGKCHAVTGSNIKSLRTALFTTGGYDIKIRPTENQLQPTKVLVGYSLLSIDYLEEVTETLKTTGYLNIKWVDEYLQWDSSNYGHVQSILCPQDEVWKPDIALTNSYTEYKELGVKSLKVLVQDDGTVSWYPFQVFLSTCSVDITYFPFDVQTCHLNFIAWSYPKSDVLLFSHDDGIYLDGYKPSSSWDIVSTSWTTNNKTQVAAITFTLKLKRKPLHFLLNVYVPLILLSTLNLFVFVLPCESGERSGYAITVFLSFAVFLTIVSSTLPENSESVAIFSVFIMSQTIQSTLITLIALVELRMNSFDENTHIPELLLLMARLSKCDVSLQRKGSSVGTVPVELSRRQSTVSLEKIDQTVTQNEESDEEKNTWRYVINGIDRLCFVVFAVMFLTTTVVCMLLTAVGN